MSTKLALFDVLCGLLQIFGLVLIVCLYYGVVPQSIYVLIGITGFAGFARFFIVEESNSYFLNTLRLVSGFSGLGIVFFSVLNVH